MKGQTNGHLPHGYSVVWLVTSPLYRCMPAEEVTLRTFAPARGLPLSLSP